MKKKIAIVAGIALGVAGVVYVADYVFIRAVRGGVRTTGVTWQTQPASDPTTQPAADTSTQPSVPSSLKPQAPSLLQPTAAEQWERSNVMEIPQRPDQAPEPPVLPGGFPVESVQADGPLPPPRPVKSPWKTAINATCIMAAVAGGLVLLAPTMSRHTCGATRSTRLQFEQRQQEIAAAAAEDAQPQPIQTLAPQP
jgi:hypothetical protein